MLHVLYAVLCVACVLRISYFPSPLSGDGVPHELPTVSVSMGDKGDECHTANCVWCVSVSMPIVNICTYVHMFMRT